MHMEIQFKKSRKQDTKSEKTTSQVALILPLLGLYRGLFDSNRESSFKSLDGALSGKGRLKLNHF
jgi:hypothetical protein